MDESDLNLTSFSKVTEETLQQSCRMYQIAQAAVQEAQEENRRLGIPNWYCIDGQIVSDLEIEKLAALREAVSREEAEDSMQFSTAD